MGLRILPERDCDARLLDICRNLKVDLGGTVITAGKGIATACWGDDEIFRESWNSTASLNLEGRFPRSDAFHRDGNQFDSRITTSAWQVHKCVENATKV